MAATNPVYGGCTSSIDIAQVYVHIAPMMTKTFILMAVLATFQRDFPVDEIDITQLSCLTDNVYHEARGEDFDGKLGVAFVTMNRVKRRDFPEFPCLVVKQGHYSTDIDDTAQDINETPIRFRCAFTWWCDGKNDDIEFTQGEGEDMILNELIYQKYVESAQAAIIAMTRLDQDVTHGATHYYNPALIKKLISERVQLEKKFPKNFSDRKRWQQLRGYRKLPEWAVKYKFTTDIGRHAYYARPRMEVASN